MDTMQQDEFDIWQRQYREDRENEQIKREKQYAILSAAATLGAHGRYGNWLECVAIASAMLKEIEERT